MPPDRLTLANGPGERAPKVLVLRDVDRERVRGTLLHTGRITQVKRLVSAVR